MVLCFLKYKYIYFIILSFFSNLADQIQAILSELGEDTDNFVKHLIKGHGELTIACYSENWLPMMANCCSDKGHWPSVICVDRYSFLPIFLIGT